MAKLTIKLSKDWMRLHAYRRALQLIARVPAEPWNRDPDQLEPHEMARAILYHFGDGETQDAK
jgi:hypothetical protein